MSKYYLGNKSIENLNKVHSDLVLVVEKAITFDVDFSVIEGFRTEERQRLLVKGGASNTMRSRHLTGHAVDLAAWLDGRTDWSWPLCRRIAKSMKLAGNILNIPIEWGGDWRTFKDGAHYQLPWSAYSLKK